MECRSRVDCTEDSCPLKSLEKALFCNVEEVERILLTIPDPADRGKLSWFIGRLEGELQYYEMRGAR